MSRRGDAPAGARRRFAVGLGAEGPPPDPTPSDGPDPYGNPDPRPAWMDVEWNRHRSRLRLGGATIDFVDIEPAATDEPPLLLVHGLDGSWRNFLETIPHFARGRRVLALDLPGFGGSPLPDWELSIPAYARVLSEFCDALGLAEVVAVGSSMGGLIVAQTTIDEPALISKLALISPVGISTATLERKPTERVARALSMLSGLSFRLREVSLRRPRLRDAASGNVFQHPDRLQPELLWEHAHSGFGGEKRIAPPGFLAAVRAVAGYDIRARLGEIRCPALIVWGHDDQLVPPQDAPEYARLIAGSRLEVFADCGHLAQLERPLRFNRLLGEFLAG